MVYLKKNYNLTYFLFLSSAQSLGPLIIKNNKPPVRPIFFKNAIICVWLEKSKWNKKAVAKQKQASNPADNLVLYPIIIKSGKIISSIIAGISSKPGTPVNSIQLKVASYVIILLIPENKNIAEIKILLIRSKKLTIN